MKYQTKKQNKFSWILILWRFQHVKDPKKEEQQAHVHTQVNVEDGLLHVFVDVLVGYLQVSVDDLNCLFCIYEVGDTGPTSRQNFSIWNNNNKIVFKT